jgi:acetyltransferase-like isoleucine patch superfamily enzyme
MIHRCFKLLANILFSDWVIHSWYRFYVKYGQKKIETSIGKFWQQRFQHVAATVRIHGKIVVSSPNNLHVGDYVRIGKNCYFSCEGGLTIGENTQISRNVTIYTNNHDVNSSWIPYDQNYVCKPVSIGKSVWIGMNVCIVPGVTIEDGAVIGMGTVVSKNVPRGAIVVGASQRIVGYRNLEAFDSAEAAGKLFGKDFPDA